MTDDQNILLGIVTPMTYLAARRNSVRIFKRSVVRKRWTEPYLDIGIFKLVKKGRLAVLFLGEMLTATAMQYFQTK